MNADQPPDRDQLLAALDTEITALASEQSAAGWTSWAILGALAALLWLAIDRYQTTDH